MATTFASSARRSASPRVRGINSWIVRVKSLVLYGGSRTGKTLWARSLGSHVYILGMISGTECMKAKEADYAVFDDMRGGFKFWPSYKEWLGAQAYVTVKCLYKEPVLVPWNKPTIYVANSDPRDEGGVTDNEIEWLNENCHFIHVDEAIFRANTE